MSRKQDRVAASDPKMKDTGTFYDPSNASQTPVGKSATAKGPSAAPVAPPVSAAAVDLEAGLSVDHTVVQPDANAMPTAEEIAAIRGKRRQFGAFTQKLALPKRPGYHRHWFNDTGARIQEATNSGWAHVKGDDGQPIRRAVGTGRDNGVLYACAMEIPEMFWQEDMSARHEAAQSRMDELKTKPFQAQAGQAQASDRGKFYSPEDAPLKINGR